MADRPTTDLASFNNDWYRPGSALRRAVWYVVNVLCFKNALFGSSALKASLLRLFGAKVGKGVVIKPCVNIKYPWKLRIGNHVWLGENVWIDNLDEVVLEDHVCLSQGAMLLCGNHDYKKSSFDLIVKPIIVKQGGWVGAQTVVCPGVTVGSHAMLAVGSIATKDLDAYSIYQGNPAQKVKDRVIDPA